MTSFVETARPQSKSWGYVFDFLCVLTGSLLITLCAQASINLWFTPVPLTLQSLAVLLVGAVLGSRKGALAVIAYLGQAAIGLPVLAGGAGGVAFLFGPTAGYLYAFVACAYVVGFLLERGWNKSYVLTAIAFFIGSILILTVGAFWLSFYVGGSYALSMGFTPFVIGDLCKVFVGATLVPSARHLLGLFG